VKFEHLIFFTQLKSRIPVVIQFGSSLCLKMPPYELWT